MKKKYIINGQNYSQFDPDETTCGCCSFFHVKNKTNDPVHQDTRGASSNYRHSHGIEDHSENSNQQKLESLKSELEAFKIELNKCQQEKEHLILSSKSELETCQLECKECQQQKEILVFRLSELMGKQLQENNLQITNLNDQYRPQKLADKLGEIYDNEWTDAFGNLQAEVANVTETDRIKILLDLLQITYDGCLNHVHERSDQIQDWFKDHNKCENSKILDFVVSIASSMISVIETEINKEVVTRYGKHVADVCTDYLQRCVTVCFYMAVKSPVMYLQFDCPSQNVDPTYFKPYTKDGEALDYLVWPALFLHKGGPLMARGVVQCQEKVLESLSYQY